MRKIPEVKLEIRKPEPVGLHEAFTKDALLIGPILGGEVEKI